MRAALTSHPDTPATPVDAIEVVMERGTGGRLDLHYRLIGRSSALLLPAKAAPIRADGLWRHTCFEAFLASPRHPFYYELNLAPSGQWAAYGFDAYRDGMRAAPMADAPAILFSATGDGLELRASVDVSGFIHLEADAAWQVGLSAVIEDRGGAISYWALAHPAGAPDFHDRDCFVLELAPAKSR